MDYKYFNECDKNKIKNAFAKYPVFETITITNPYRDLTKAVYFVPSLYNNSHENIKIYRNHSE